MARYRGPKSKIARRFREAIFGRDKALERKNYPPGMHGPNQRRPRKQSEYAIQLMEKQKAKHTYGVLERQFENLFHKASRRKGITGESLLKMLEARLDNTVYRMGVARTRRAARQFVLHKHITVNGEVVNIPSYQLRPGDTIAVRDKSRTLEAVVEANSRESARRFNWLDWNSSEMQGRFIDYPERDQIPENIKEQLIVELYSK